MASPKELDIFSRSLGGDYDARLALYKKFVRANAQVCRVGAGYPNLKDFLHDCMSNLLRTGHSWDTEDSLNKWVESVALWTALINIRQRDMHVRGAQGEIRMCAEMEGEGLTGNEVLPVYAPPLLGADDSPAARVLAMLNEPQKTVFRKRALENASWKETAAAAGKPLSAVAQIFARTTGRVVRLFGAPPPMDDDLAPIISRFFSEPRKPEGRAISLQLDPAFYALTPELHHIGVNTANDARMIVLWDAARQSAPPGEALRRHLEQCHYCADLLRALLLMQQALARPPGVAFHLCPGAFTLANAPDLVREAFDQHLAQCSICRAERTQLLDGQTSGLDPETAREKSTGPTRQKIAWMVGAALFLGISSLGG